MILPVAFAAGVTLGEPSSRAIKAGDVAEALREGGISFASPIAEEQPIEGARSRAVAATQEAGVNVMVFDSNEARYEARLGELETCRDCTYAVQCGPILVTFAPEQMFRDVEQARSQTVYQILKTRYGCD